jgi:hypothetical protein
VGSLNQVLASRGAKGHGRRCRRGHFRTICSFLCPSAGSRIDLIGCHGPIVLLDGQITLRPGEIDDGRARQSLAGELQFTCVPLFGGVDDDAHRTESSLSRTVTKPAFGERQRVPSVKKSRDLVAFLSAGRREQVEGIVPPGHRFHLGFSLFVHKKCGDCHTLLAKALLL